MTPRSVPRGDYLPVAWRQTGQIPAERGLAEVAAGPESAEGPIGAVR
jgi:hypothetical protein